MTCDNCGSEAVRGGRICFVCNRMVNGEPTRPHDEAWVKAEIEWNEAQDKKGGECVDPRHPLAVQGDGGCPACGIEEVKENH